MKQLPKLTVYINSQSNRRFCCPPAIPPFLRNTQPNLIMRLSSHLRRGFLLPAVLLPGLIMAQTTYTPYTFNAVSTEGVPPTGTQGGAASDSRFDHPAAVVTDSHGNTFVTDTNNSTIRMISSDGVVSTIAGVAGITGSVDGAGSAARFFRPAGLAIDSADNLYVSDTGNDTIRQVSPTGVVTTWAGLAGTSGFADGTGSAARFRFPLAITIDQNGNAYVADAGNNTVRKITPAGAVTTVAGVGMMPSAGSTDATGVSARFNLPNNTAVDSSGNIYVADGGNHIIRKIDTNGAVTTVAGVAGVRGIADGTGSAAFFNYPAGLAVDSSGNIYEAEPGSTTIRKITSAGVVTTVAGVAGFAGAVDGTGTAARFNSPEDVCVDGTGNVYVADTGNCTIRKITPAGVVSTVAGTAGRKGYIDSTGLVARFNFPFGVALDNQGHIIVTDTENNMIRKINFPDTLVSTVAGAASNAGYLDGPASTAQFNSPGGVAFDNTSGSLYVADTGNNTIRQIDASGTVSAFAGAGLAGTSGADTDIVPRGARFDSPNNLAFDSSGNLYVADTGNDTIRKIGIDPASGTVMVRTPAGVALSPGQTDGASVGSQFFAPNGIWVDASGNIYIADTGNNATRKIIPGNGNAAVSTLAGQMTNQGSTDGWGTAARFKTPTGLTIDSAGNVYVADTGNATLRRITPAGMVSTLAGIAGVSGSTDSSDSTVATFYSLWGLTIDKGGNLYGTDINEYTIRRITPDGKVITLAGQAGVTGSTDGTGTGALFNSPGAAAAYTDPGSGATTVYIADSGNSTIRQMTLSTDASGNPVGVVTTFAGNATTAGSTDGTGTAAQFFGPEGVAVDGSGNLFVADTSNETIRKITPAGVVTTLAGSAGTKGSLNGSGTFAQFNLPHGLIVDGSGNIYVADTYNYVIRKIAPDGTVTTLAGTAGSPGHVDGTGGDARFNAPHSVVLDSAGNLYVSDTGNDTIRKVTPAGVVTTVAGVPPLRSLGSADGPAQDARFAEPNGVAVDKDGTVYVGDTYSATVRKIDPSGATTTIAGTVGATGSGDGLGSAAQFWYPYGVAVDSDKNVYVADAFNSTIRKIDPTGTVTTLAGMAGQRGSLDGTGSAAVFYQPTSVAVDSAKNVYVADSNNNTIRKITPAGAVTTLAGLAGIRGYADAAGSAARFTTPTGVAVDGAGNVYVADSGTNTIRKITPTGVVTTLAGSWLNAGSVDGTGTAAWFSGPSSVAVDGAGYVYVTDSNNQTIRRITPSGVVTTLAGVAGLAGSASVVTTPDGVIRRMVL